MAFGKLDFWLETLDTAVNFAEFVTKTGFTIYSLHLASISLTISLHTISLTCFSYK